MLFAHHTSSDAGINFKTGAHGQINSQLKKPTSELWSNVDLTSEKGGTPPTSKPANMGLMPLEMPAEPYAEPIRVQVDTTRGEVSSSSCTQGRLQSLLHILSGFSVVVSEKESVASEPIAWA